MRAYWGNYNYYGNAGGSGSFGTGGAGGNANRVWLSSSGCPGYQNCGAGGSGYVYTSSTYSNYPSGCKLNSSYYLTSAAAVGGNTSFTAPGGSNETGHNDNGYARITNQTVNPTSRT